MYSVYKYVKKNKYNKENKENICLDKIKVVPLHHDCI